MALAGLLGLVAAAVLATDWIRRHVEVLTRLDGPQPPQLTGPQPPQHTDRRTARPPCHPGPRTHRTGSPARTSGPLTPRTGSLAGPSGPAGCPPGRSAHPRSSARPRSCLAAEIRCPAAGTSYMATGRS